MTDSKEVPIKINKKNSEDKILFKRFKINLKNFKIEKSDFDEELTENNLNKVILNQKTENQELAKKKEVINRFKDEDDLIIKHGLNKNNEFIDYDDLIYKENKTHKNLLDKQNTNEKNVEKSLSSAENEILNEKLPLSSKIIDTIFLPQVKNFSILPILGIAIGIILIIIGVLILLGNSDKVVDNVISGETTASSVLFGIVGMLFIALSLLKINPPKKVFGNIFNIIEDFESESNEENGRDVINLKSEEKVDSSKKHQTKRKKTLNKKNHT